MQCITMVDPAPLPSGIIDQFPRLLLEIMPALDPCLSTISRNSPQMKRTLSLSKVRTLLRQPASDAWLSYKTLFSCPNEGQILMLYNDFTWSPLRPLYQKLCFSAQTCIPPFHPQMLIWRVLPKKVPKGLILASVYFLGKPNYIPHHCSQLQPS